MRNASNAQVDLLHLIELSNSFDCSVQDVSSEYGLIAIQGRNSEKFLKENFKKDFAKINRMHFSKLNFGKKNVLSLGQVIRGRRLRNLSTS